MTTNSPIATVNHVNKKGTLKTIFNSIAIMNIVKVNTAVLKIILCKIPLINFAEKIVIDKAMIDWLTPKTKSMGPSGENRLVRKTPITIPKNTFC